MASARWFYCSLWSLAAVYCSRSFYVRFSKPAPPDTRSCGNCKQSFRASQKSFSLRRGLEARKQYCMRRASSVWMIVLLQAEIFLLGTSSFSDKLEVLISRGVLKDGCRFFRLLGYIIFIEWLQWLVRGPPRPSIWLVKNGQSFQHPY